MSVYLFFKVLLLRFNNDNSLVLCIEVSNITPQVLILYPMNHVTDSCVMYESFDVKDNCTRQEGESVPLTPPIVERVQFQLSVESRKAQVSDTGPLRRSQLRTLVRSK